MNWIKQFFQDTLGDTSGKITTAGASIFGVTSQGVYDSIEVVWYATLGGLTGAFIKYFWDQVIDPILPKRKVEEE